ncbi:MAG TPA: twin-arginine translocase TatA/TatE family subunit, partial [Bacillota bacterium]|nr:twin-arginine translocase TatA/TatE family subunit [Bacillota bacterium]
RSAISQGSEVCKLKLGPLEVVVIFAVILLVFGPSKLPQIGKAFGKGLREFKSASKEISSQLDMDDDEEEQTKAKKQN